MRKIAYTLVAGLLCAPFVTAPALAETRTERAERNAPTAAQLSAQADAQTARIKADLRLTADQEKSWPGFETALRDIGKLQAEREVARRDERAKQTGNEDFIDEMNRHSKYLGDRSANLKILADAAKPLYASLDETQKRRFVKELNRLSRE